MKDHKISLLSAVLLSLNIMVGSGILIGSGASAAIAGNASFLGWLLVFACFLPLVLCVIKLSQLFPGAGGMYLYAQQGLGATAGYISAWLYMTGYTFTIVVETLALRQTLAVNTNHYWLFESPMIFNAVVIGLCLVLSLASLKLINRFLNSLTIIKLLPLIILIVLLPFIVSTNFTITTTELSALPFSLPLLIFGYFGFEYCTSLSHLLHNPEKNAPRAIFLGFLATAVLYTLFHFGLLNLMGAQNLATLGASAFAQFITIPIPYLAPFLGLLIPAAASITLFAVALGVMNSNATLLHTLASEKVFNGSSLIAQTTSWGRPWAALILQSIVALIVLTYVPNLNIVGGLCVLAVFSSFLLPLISLVMVARKRKLNSVLITGIIGLTALIGFIFYSWYTLAPDLPTRVAYSALLLTSLGIGLAVKRKS